MVTFLFSYYKPFPLELDPKPNLKIVRFDTPLKVNEPVDKIVNFTFYFTSRITDLDKQEIGIRRAEY